MHLFIVPAGDEAIDQNTPWLNMTAKQMIEDHRRREYVEVPANCLHKYGLFGGSVEENVFDHALELKRLHKYSHHDIVEIDVVASSESLSQFALEHRHVEDEVRLIVDGEGVFDIRVNNDPGRLFVRAILQDGDWIIIPKHRFHRFFCTGIHRCQAVRLFGDNPMWTPLYREPRSKP